MIKYHAQDIKTLLYQLKTNEQGLSNKEVKQRRGIYGYNRITDANKVKISHIFFRQFKNIMVVILLIAMIVSYKFDEIIDAAAIGIIVFIIAIMGFIQEFRAEKAVAALKKMLTVNALVVREGKISQIEASELVPGDIIILKEGARIPADARLIEAMQLKCIESALTGESLASEKHTLPIKEYKSIGDLGNMVFMGSVISQGHGKAVVTDIGMQTEFGKIASMVQKEKNELTPLQKQLNQLSKILAGIILFAITLLFLSAVLMGRDIIEMFMLSISLAVSVIPEGLPAVITLTLAIGVQKMASENAIIRTLSSAETLGSTDVICTDKTGTLTQNQMTVQVIWIDEVTRKVSGLGYSPKGEIEGEASQALNMLLKIAGLCNNSALVKENDCYKALGDPTEACLLTLAYKGGVDPQVLAAKEPRSKEYIFDSERKLMSTINNNTLLTKGAPEVLIEKCSHALYHGKIYKLTKKMKSNIMKVNEEWANEAHRVLAMAYKPLKKNAEPEEKNLIFVGLVGMIDPPRREIKYAIEKCHQAHIDVIMITGDHVLTAKAIGKLIGLYNEGDKIISGFELEKMSITNLRKIVDKVKIYARVNPKHKVKILKALQEKGHIVAMTGDGVNDAPALKRADIGITMGITGTDVAKEAGNMILTDDNFATIVKAVEKGRVIYRNIKKFVRYSLSGNFDEMLFISIVFLLGTPLPFIPLQILWINLLTDALPGIALGIDVPQKNIMKLKPRDGKKSIWKDLLSFSILAGIVSTTASLLLYFRYLGYQSIEHTRTIIMTFTVIYELLLVFVVRYEHSHFFSNFFKNKLMLFGTVATVILQIFVIYSPFMQDILETRPLKAIDWMWILGICMISISILEMWKKTKTQSEYV